LCTPTTIICILSAFIPDLPGLPDDSKSNPGPFGNKLLFHHVFQALNPPIFQLHNTKSFG